MASSFDRVRSSRLTGRKSSTAQACLQRILHTIATCPNARENHPGDGDGSTGIDLALTLGPAGSSDAELLKGESDLTIEKGSENIHEAADGSEINNGGGYQKREGGLEQSGASELGDSQDRPGRSKLDGSLGLLVEAASWVSGGFGDGDGSELEGQWRRVGGLGGERTGVGWKDAEDVASQGSSGGGGRNLCGEVREVPEAVGRRSERRRNRVLPCRYRDSVLEPYWKPPPPRRRRRMSDPVSSNPRPR